MTISREQWQAVSPLLTAALEMPSDARAAWLDALDAQQPDLSPLLRSLLAADQRAQAGHAFETASVLLTARDRAPSDLHPDQLVGPYRLLRPLGHGGMGEVWLARQVQGGITRDIALKLPALLGQSSVWRERFRRERDILAKLQHPHIATLFDAGVSEAADSLGQPYLAMEYVEGVSLLEHAALHALTLRARILLFRQVLAAVGCAHRQLVIHRDIKPSNILVSAAGQAKLLDFGIAKLLDDTTTNAAADDLTRLGGRLLTFRYAAPEQVHGEMLGTATDVYALGVVLHELLTGKSPYQRIRAGAAPGLADFQQQDFARPSSLTLTKGLAGDLDAILLKALRRDPADRYGTVEQFDDDLLRFLDRRPVLARRGNRRYRAGRFLLRNRLPLMAAGVMSLSLVAGLVIAERERRIAVAAQVRAERHFASVRELANTFIRDIDGKLAGIAGSLPARQQLAETSVKYLDQLAAEVGQDKALAAEVASGYARMGEVFGGGAGGVGNLGQQDAAIATLNKAARLLDNLSGDAGDTLQTKEERARVHYNLAVVYFRKGDPRWEQESLRSIAELRELLRLDASSRWQLAAANQLFAHINMLTTLDHALHLDSPLLAEGRELLAAAASNAGNDTNARVSLARSYQTLADALAAPGGTPGQSAEALQAAHAGRDILLRLVHEAPDNMQFALLLSLTRGASADALLSLGRFQEAEEEIQLVTAELGNLQARDPLNMTIAGNHWAAMAEGVETAFRVGRFDIARQRAEQARAIRARMILEAAQVSELDPYQARADYFEGLALLSAGATLRGAACRHLQAVAAYLPQLRGTAAGDAIIAARYAQLSTHLAQCPPPPETRK